MNRHLLFKIFTLTLFVLSIISCQPFGNLTTEEFKQNFKIKNNSVKSHCLEELNYSQLASLIYDKDQSSGVITYFGIDNKTGKLKIRIPVFDGLMRVELGVSTIKKGMTLGFSDQIDSMYCNGTITFSDEGLVVQGVSSNKTKNSQFKTVTYQFKTVYLPPCFRLNVSTWSNIFTYTESDYVNITVFIEDDYSYNGQQPYKPNLKIESDNYSRELIDMPSHYFNIIRYRYSLKNQFGVLGLFPVGVHNIKVSTSNPVFGEIEATISIKVESSEEPSEPCQSPSPSPSDSGGGGGFIIFNSDNQLSPSCPPSPSSQPTCSGNIVTPTQLSGLNSKVQSCNPINKTTFSSFVKQNNIVNNLQSKGYSIQATKDERNQAKINEANTLRNQYKEQILSELSTLQSQVQNIVSEAQTVTGENYTDSYSKPSSLSQYKEQLEELQDEYTSLVNSGNTFGLSEASFILTQEVKLYNDLINDFFNGSVFPIVDESNESGNETPPDEEVVETPSRLSTLDTPIKVIRYTTNLINRQKVIFDKKLTKLTQELDNNFPELQTNLNDSLHDSRILMAMYLYDKGFLDLETLSIKENSSFSIQANPTHTTPLTPEAKKNLEDFGNSVRQILNIDLIPQEYKDESIRFWSDMPQSEWDRLSTEDPQVITELRSSFEFLLNSSGVPSDVKGVAISAGIGQAAKFIGNLAPKSYNYLTKKFTELKDKLKNQSANSLKNQGNKVQQRQNQIKNICKSFSCVKNSYPGTVWDYINLTQPTHLGTIIPKSFEIITENSKYWVHPNATKHMVEYLRSLGKPDNPLLNQQVLNSFRGAINEISKSPIQYEKMNIVNGWEVIFSKARPGSKLPVIKHALYRGI